MALAEKEKKTGKIAIVFIGDGTLGEGVLYESLNIASLWALPLLVILEDNHYAQTTPTAKAVAGSMPARFDAFRLKVWERDTTDVLEIQSTAREAIQHVRSGAGPACLLLHTYRFSAHSKGDDPRSAQELARIRQFDPLTVHARRLTAAELEKAEAEVTAEINNAFLRADNDPFPILSVERQTSHVGRSTLDV
jgi:TPP-dependent pyruvate/acetoin dehydrogenase alpha subunit